MKSYLCFVAVAFALSRCGSTEPRGEQYFSAHPDEAKQVVAGCANGTARENECYNAEVPVSKAKLRKVAPGDPTTLMHLPEVIARSL